SASQPQRRRTLSAGYPTGTASSWTVPTGWLKVRRCASGALPPTVRRRNAAAETAHREHLQNVRPETGRDVAPHGRRCPGRVRRLPATAGLGAATGRLSDHADPDVLPRREPRGRDVFDHGAARETVWPGARPHPDDVDQFVRQLADHVAVFARSQYRY